MSDWAARPQGHMNFLSTYQSGIGDFALGQRLLGGAGAAWPAANRAIYVPVSLTGNATAFAFGIRPTIQSGNVDVGLYNMAGTRLVSSGSTAVGVATGVQVINTADTALTPGIYFIGMVCGTVSASFARIIPPALIAQVCGVQQEALGATTLPATWTPANPASAFVPMVTVSLRATL